MVKLSKVHYARGAPMGRSNVYRQPTERIYLRHIRLDSGGYDEGGAYWGIGQRLYHACEYIPDGLDIFFRAASRDAAKRHLLDKYPNAKFYR